MLFDLSFTADNYSPNRFYLQSIKDDGSVQNHLKEPYLNLSQAVNI